MGGPKAFLEINGQPILRYLLERFEWPGSTMLVLAPGMDHPPGVEGFAQVLSDPVTGVGPLRGVLTALEWIVTEMVVVATVDMPGITREQLSWMAQQLFERPEAAGVMARHANGQIEPFPSAYRTSARAIIAEQLDQQRRSVHGLLQHTHFASIQFPHDWPDETWVNLNTPQDLGAFTRKPA